MITKTNEQFIVEIQDFYEEISSPRMFKVETNITKFYGDTKREVIAKMLSCLVYQTRMAEVTEDKEEKEQRETNIYSLKDAIEKVVEFPTK